MALLDIALDLELSERQSWVASLGQEHIRHAPMLETLLSDHLHAAEADASADAQVDRGEPVPVLGDGSSLVGPYRLLRQIGQGGMATVWLAERADALLTRRVALKLPHVTWNSASFAARMSRERHILASLNHPNIARLYDVGTAEDGRPFLALEYIDGQPIDEYARAHDLSVAARVELVVQVARAVAHAHTQLVVHRDLKPSNILVDRDGRTHLLDFGIAKLIDAAEADDSTKDGLTQAQGRVLTADYASPEQIGGDLIGTPSDIYSLGVVLFELLAGDRPYRFPRGLGAAPLARAMADIDVRRPSDVATEASLRRTLKGDLDAIVTLALRKASTERYATVDAFADDLERHLRGEPVRARPADFGYRAERWVRRHKLEAVVGTALIVAVPAGAAAQAAVFIAVGAGSALALWLMKVAREQAKLARREAERASQVKDFTLSILQAANTESGARAATTAVDLLKAAQARIETELADSAEISVELMTSIGEGLLGLGELDDAARILRKAVDRAQADLSVHHSLTSAARVAYGSVLTNLDRGSEAIPLLLSAISGARRHGDNHVLVEGLRWLSSCRIREGNIDAGVTLSQDAVDVVTAAGVSARKQDAMNAWASLASALIVAQRDGVVAAAQAALAYADDLPAGRLSEPVIAVRNILARGLAMEDRDAEALAVFDAVLADAVTYFGEKFVGLDAIYNYRGHVRVDAGDVAGAIADFNEQLEITRSRTGDGGVNLGLGHSSLGRALSAAHRHREALHHYELSARLLKDAAGANHLSAARSLSAGALMLTRLERVDDAEEAFAAIPVSWWEGSDVERAAHFGRLAELRVQQRRNEEAIALAEAALSGLRRHPSTTTRAGAFANLGRAYLASGDDENGVESLREAVQLYQNKLLHSLPDQMDALAALAAATASGSLQAPAGTTMNQASQDQRA